MADASTRQNRLPGFHLPLNFIPTESDPDYVGPPFPNLLYDLGGSATIPRTAPLEFTMLHLMNEITDKVDWDRKVFNDEVVSEWKSESLSASGVDMTEKTFNCCIDELRYKAKIFHETGAIVVYNGDVVKSDSAVPSSVQQALQAAVKPLEDVPGRMKDWYPDSDGKVLDLVNPSLFPLMYGVSRVLPHGVTTLEDCIQRCGEGDVVPIPPVEDARLDRRSWLQDPYSRLFQWLPCEVDISGEHAKITSYINNLHPQRHPDLYDVIAQVITRAIPFWNFALAPFQHDPPRYFMRIKYNKGIDDPDPEFWPETEEPQQEEGEDKPELIERREECIGEIQRIVLSGHEVFTPPKKEVRADLKGKFGSRGLQVIVRLANIELTPEKPTYKGGLWHIEGQLNEHICATALYYYASENITESSLVFLQHSDAGAYDIEDLLEQQTQWEDPPSQDVGRVATRAGRLIAFPNILHHRVEPFWLADATRPGYRKVLALFLVDPHMRVLSTAHVPPQQRAWWRDALDSPFVRLPVEIRDMIVADVDGFPLALDEVKRDRRELKEELDLAMEHIGEPFLENIVWPCEH